jgi:dATP pyrophosphohydrolase
MRYKQPRSVQVVVFADTRQGREYLLLKRVAGFGGFWQSVTGSLEEGETHAEAAVREVLEETGIIAGQRELIDLSLVNTFEIAPRWRVRYGPGVTHNEEVCFALRVDKCEVRLDPVEHDEYAWAGYEKAIEMLYWDSNKRAFEALRRMEV